MRLTPRKKHKKIIYKYIDLHMPVTRKGAGGATAFTRMRFSGPTMKERRRRDTHTESVREARRRERAREHKAEAEAEAGASTRGAWKTP